MSTTNTLRVERAGNVLPMAVRLRNKIGPGDYVVVDDEDNVMSDTHSTRADAEADLRDLLAAS